MDKFSFSRFTEKRNYKSRDTAGYDEYVEGVEPDETASLETFIGESNMGYRLVQKMGWKTGSGLGRDGQGRHEPIPFELKDDNMGLGRWSYEVEQAQDATDKRKQMETEKEVTADLVEKYKTQAEKEEKLAETIYEMNKSYYCDLCEKQYFNYSEYDNHINSHDHHHRQRLKDLKQWESERRFGGHREEEEKKKKRALYKVAVERAHMLKRQARRKTAPGFKPIGSEGAGTTSLRQPTQVSTNIYQGSAISVEVKRSIEDRESKVSEKKGRISKYGSLKFQSAGNLVTVGDGVRMEEGDKKGRGYHDSVKREESRKTTHLPVSSSLAERIRTPSPQFRTDDKQGVGSNRGDPDEDEGSKFSFGFSKNKKSQYRPRGCDPPEEDQVKKNRGTVEKEGEETPRPPPLMSRQRELMTKAFGGDSDSDGEEEDGRAELVKMAARGTPRFRFQIRK